MTLKISREIRDRGLAHGWKEIIICLREKKGPGDS